jgi:hypothetical protein
LTPKGFHDHLKGGNPAGERAERRELRSAQVSPKTRIIQSSAVVALLAGLAGQAGATSIPITNPGFESPVLVNGAFTQTPPTGWSGGGAFNPTTANFPGEAPEGQNTGYSNGSAISQTLSIVLAANTTYALTVLVGDRLDTAFPGYHVQLLAGSTILSECATCVTPLNGSFALVTVTYTTGASDPLIGQALSIVLDSDGLQTNFDDVRLDAVPEPSSLALLSSSFGAMAVAWSRRRRKSVF